MATTNLSNLQQGQQQPARRVKTIFDFLDDPRVRRVSAPWPESS